MDSIAKDLDFRKNKIHRAKVGIADRTALENDDVIDKEYADDLIIYETELSADPTMTPQEVGGIDKRTELHGKNTSEILDEMFFPRVLHKYVHPSATLVVEIFDAGTTTPAAHEVGLLVDVKLTCNVTNNDSAGPVAFSFTGSGINTALTGTSETETISGYVLQKENTWEAEITYNAPAVQNDSRGDADPIGHPDALRWVDGTKLKSEQKSVTSYWPIWTTQIDGTVALPTTADIHTVLTNGKYIGAMPRCIDMDILGDNNTKTVIVAIPIEGTAIPEIEIKKDRTLSLTAAFSENLLTNVPDVTGSGQFSNYAVFRHVVIAGYSVGTEYEIELESFCDFTGSSNSPAPTPTPTNPAELPLGTLGAELRHDGTEWVTTRLIVETVQVTSGLTFNLAEVPMPGQPFRLYKNGFYQTPNIDYTLVGNEVTFIPATAITVPTRFTYEYYRKL